jgi:hypothetical protein
MMKKILQIDNWIVSRALVKHIVQQKVKKDKFRFTVIWKMLLHLIFYREHATMNTVMVNGFRHLIIELEILFRIHSDFTEDMEVINS